jgi:hypothetical protein
MSRPIMKHKINVLPFLAVLFTVLVLNILRTPDEISFTERRRLAQFPPLTAAGVMSGDFMSRFDDFAVDQMAGRNSWRRLKAIFDLHALRRADNNGIFLRGGHVFKIEYPLNERSVSRLCGIVNSMTGRYLDDAAAVYYAIVPDKCYHIQNTGSLTLDYARMEQLIREQITPEAQYIDLFGALSIGAPTPTGGRNICFKSPAHLPGLLGYSLTTHHLPPSLLTGFTAYTMGSLPSTSSRTR